MADPGSGERRHTADVVLYWMQRRGMTRQVFADRTGKSLSWVDKIRRVIGSWIGCRCCGISRVCWIFR
jgi:hypothetical protein